MEKKKIAILFFGLTRSLPETLPNLETFLFNEITSCGFEYDIFIHTFILNGVYKNPWAKENISNYNNDAYKLLNAKHVLLDNQQDIEKQINFEEYCKKTKYWGSHTRLKMVKYLIHNMVLALYSKKQITNLLQEHANEYEFAIIMRPDLKLTTKINISKFINTTTNNNIIIPKQDVFNKANDRFCFATIPNAIYYGTLYDKLLNYSKKKAVHAERYLYEMLIEKNLQIIYSSDIVYKTIRASEQNQTTTENFQNRKPNINLYKNKIIYLDF